LTLPPSFKNPDIGSQLKHKLLTAKRKHYLPYLYQISHILVNEKNPTFLKDSRIVCAIIGKQCLIFLCALAFFVVKYEFVRFVSVWGRPWAKPSGRVSVAL